MKEFLNLLTTPREVLRMAFDAVEYEGFFEKGPFGINSTGRESIGGILQNRERLAKDWEIGSPDLDSEDLAYFNRMHMGTIYGDGGFNRYFVYGNGRIVFSEGHSRDDDATCHALFVGFEVAKRFMSGFAEFCPASGTITSQSGHVLEVLGVEGDRFICKLDLFNDGSLMLISLDSVADENVKLLPVA